MPQIFNIFKDTKPFKSFPFAEEIKQASWNPSVSSNLLVVTADGKLAVLNIETGERATVSSGDVTSGRKVFYF